MNTINWLPYWFGNLVFLEGFYQGVRKDVIRNVFILIFCECTTLNFQVVAEYYVKKILLAFLPLTYVSIIMV